jgi:4-alpha-glucanotransferase
VNWGRISGILLHITSLPSRYGIGDLGAEAFRFADWLTAAGQRIWQVLPLGPTGYGESPYQLFSAFAGNPLLLNLDTLIHRGWLAESELGRVPRFAHTRVEFERVIPWKTKILRRAFQAFRAHAADSDRRQFQAFCQENRAWLDDYSRFMALKEAQRNVAWTQWAAASHPNQEEIEYHQFLQFEFFRQWDALKRYCAGRGIHMMGDLPIYVAHDSADVWAHPELFRFNAVAGVPPDYFSASGQLWGNPVYRWDHMAATGYRWWMERLRAALRQFDAVRMDHFRGFEAYWEVPTGATTAVNGRWEKGPGAEFFRALKAELGPLPLVAENLGVITAEVEALRHEFHFPGMAVLQFAFGNDPQAPSFQPHNYERNLVAYTGTHDNDTVLGWWSSEGGDSTRTAEQIEKEKAHARAYLGTTGREMNWVLIRELLKSVADTALIPLQDVLGLGSQARMNTPATASGNWRWRCRPDSFNESLARRLRELCDLYGRSPGAAILEK